MASSNLSSTAPSSILHKHSHQPINTSSPRSKLTQSASRGGAIVPAGRIVARARASQFGPAGKSLSLGFAFARRPPLKTARNLGNMPFILNNRARPINRGRYLAARALLRAHGAPGELAFPRGSLYFSVICYYSAAEAGRSPTPRYETNN